MSKVVLYTCGSLGVRCHLAEQQRDRQHRLHLDSKGHCGVEDIIHSQELKWEEKRRKKVELESNWRIFLIDGIVFWSKFAKKKHSLNKDSFWQKKESLFARPRKAAGCEFAGIGFPCIFWRHCYFCPKVVTDDIVECGTAAKMSTSCTGCESIKEAR